MPDVDVSWVRRFGNFPEFAKEDRLIDVPALHRTHVALDKSVLDVPSREFKIPKLDLKSGRVLATIADYHVGGHRTLLHIPRLERTGDAAQSDAALWCSTSRFQLPDLSHLPWKTEELRADVVDADIPMPDVHEPSSTTATEEELYRALEALLCGRESRLFIWNAQRQEFSVNPSTLDVGNKSTKSRGVLISSFCGHATNIRRLKLVSSSILGDPSGHNATLIALAVFLQDFVDLCTNRSSMQVRDSSQKSSIISLCRDLEHYKEAASWLVNILGGIGREKNTIKISAVQLFDVVYEEVKLQTCISSVFDQIVRELFDKLLAVLAQDLQSRTGLGFERDSNTGLLAIVEKEDYSGLTYVTETRPAIITSELCETILQLEKGMIFLNLHGSAQQLRSLHDSRSSNEPFVSLNETSRPAMPDLEMMLSHDVINHSFRDTILSSSGSRSKEDLANKVQLQMIESSASLSMTDAHTERFRLALARHTTQSSSIDLDGLIHERLVRPIVEQGVFIHGEVQQILLSQMRLAEYLDLAQQIFLFRNGLFVLKLREAIFATSSGSLNLYRKTSNAGRWPPAAAKVSVALRSLLMSSIDQKYFVSSKHALAEPELLGNLGVVFALDDSPEELPRESVDALSFLVFGFRPPKPVDLIITHASLNLYKKINQFLLRMLRVQEAILQLSSGASQFRMMRRISSSAERFRIEASQFVQSFTAHIYDTVIAVQVQIFMRQLHKPGNSIEGIRDAHQHMLEQICHGALLSSRLTEIESILRQALESVLAFSYIRADSSDVDELEIVRLYKVFRQSSRKLITILMGAEATKEDSFAAGITARFMME